MTPEWLPAWNWNCSKYPNGLVILASASEEFFAQLRGQNRNEFTASLTKDLPWLPGFWGMVYGMRTRQEIGHVKGGKSYNVWKRLAQSPWVRELRYTSHEDRIEDLVLLCFNVPNSTVEKALHRSLGPPVDIDRFGREWFDRGQSRVIQALSDILDDHHARVWIDADISDLRLLFEFDMEADIKLFADVGEVEHIYDRKDGIDVVSSVWCSVQFSTSESRFLTPFYSLPDLENNPSYEHLLRELRSFAVDEFHIEPDVITMNGTCESVSPDQYVVQSEFVRKVCPFEVPNLDHNLNEWEVGDEIHEIDYHVRIFVLERFCQTERGGLRRECCEQFFIPGDRLPLSKQELKTELRCNPHSILPFSTTLASSSSQ